MWGPAVTGSTCGRPVACDVRHAYNPILKRLSPEFPARARPSASLRVRDQGRLIACGLVRGPLQVIPGACCWGHPGHDGGWAQKVVMSRACTHSEWASSSAGAPITPSRARCRPYGDIETRTARQLREGGRMGEPRARVLGLFRAFLREANHMPTPTRRDYILKKVCSRGLLKACKCPSAACTGKTAAGCCPGLSPPSPPPFPKIPHLHPRPPTRELQAGLHPVPPHSQSPFRHPSPRAPPHQARHEFRKHRDAEPAAAEFALGLGETQLESVVVQVRGAQRGCCVEDARGGRRLNRLCTVTPGSCRRWSSACQP
jgi:hypothetical protein